MPKFIASLLGILAIASLAGCATDTQQPENQNETKIVKIGVILPLS
jgi:outer membrane biogenesis lipoprotein LolB